MILISGVVLLTLKKPERRGGAPTTPRVAGPARMIRPRHRRSSSKQDLEQGGSEVDARELDEDQTLWQVGDASDDEDGDDVGSTGRRSEGQRTPRQLSPKLSRKPQQQQHPGEEGRGLIEDEETDEDEGESGRRSGSPVPSLSSNTAVWR